MLVSEGEDDVVLAHVESDSGLQMSPPSTLGQEESTGPQSGADLTQLWTVDCRETCACVCVHVGAGYKASTENFAVAPK